MTDTKYNGWTNWETWNFNLWYDNCFNDDAENALSEAEGDREEAITQLADYIESFADETLELPKTGFLADIAGAAVRSVNWREIAEHYIDDMIDDWKENNAA